MTTITRLGIYRIDNPSGRSTIDFSRETSYGSSRIVAKVFFNGSVTNLYGDCISIRQYSAYTRPCRYGTEEVREFEDVPFLEIDEQEQDSILTRLFQAKHAIDVVVEKNMFGRMDVFELVIR